MKNKLIPIGLLTFMLLILFTIGYFNKEEKIEVDMYQEAVKINYTEILNDESGTVIYYFYQESCGYCNSIKEQLTELYLEIYFRSDISLKLVDMGDEANNGAWQTDADDPNLDMLTLNQSTIEDLYIKGTPTMVYVVEGEIVLYSVGIDVFTVLEKAKEDFELTTEFDQSVYGHN